MGVPDAQVVAPFRLKGRFFGIAAGAETRGRLRRGLGVKTCEMGGGCAIERGVLGCERLSPARFDGVRGSLLELEGNSAIVNCLINAAFRLRISRQNGTYLVSIENAEGSRSV